MIWAGAQTHPIQQHRGALGSGLGAEMRQKSSWLLRVVLNPYLSDPSYYWPLVCSHSFSLLFFQIQASYFTVYPDWHSLRSPLANASESFYHFSEWLRIEIHRWTFTSNNPFKKKDPVIVLGQMFRLRKFLNLFQIISAGNFMWSLGSEIFSFDRLEDVRDLGKVIFQYFLRLARYEKQKTAFKYLTKSNWGFPPGKTKQTNNHAL